MIKVIVIGITGVVGSVIVGFVAVVFAFAEMIRHMKDDD